ncbi:MAG: hypothetical protein M3Y56_13305 [Armatimonadota bacterium]|nr:hypothetical protein [Armatimonadota bacterium]
MRTINRKSAPRVMHGHVQMKNRWDLSPDYYSLPQAIPLIDRRKPGEGYRHILRQKDLHDFVAILPDWDELSHGLNALVLAPGEPDQFGYHVPGVIHICAWERRLWKELYTDFYESERPVLARLGVPAERSRRGYLCKFTEGTVRAYQLLSVLLHELGHHHDRITTRAQEDSCRGEPYAEQYARAYQDRIWDRYLREFSLD